MTSPLTLSPIQDENRGGMRGKHRTIPCEEKKNRKGKSKTNHNCECAGTACRLWSRMVVLAARNVSRCG